jgi:hypothetical protein
VASVFVQSIGRNFDEALRMLDAALADCPDELWATDLWPDEAPTAPAPHGGLHGSAPWFLGYVDHCRGRVRHVLGTLTEDAAARPVPSAHRHHGVQYGLLVGSLPLHVVEHAAQIRQFLTAAGVAVRPLPGDRGYVP